MATHEHWQDSLLSSSNAHTQQPFAVRAVHLLQELHLSLHRRCFPILSKDITCGWTAGRGLLVLLTTAAFLIILLSAHAQTPHGFAVDGALLAKVLTIDFSSLLCWEEVHQPFFLKTSLDLEVGLNIKGTLVYTVPAFSRRRSSSNDEDLVSGWTKEKERTLMKEDGHSAKTFDAVSDPPPYSHTEAQSVAESRVNQIVSPLSVIGSKALDVHTQGQPLLFHRRRVSRLKRSARRRFNQSQRLVRQLPEVYLRREKVDDKDSSEKIKTGSESLPAARQKVMPSSEKGRKRNRRKGNRSISLNRNQKPADLHHHHQTIDNNNNNMLDKPPKSHSSAQNPKKLQNSSQTDTMSFAVASPRKGYSHIDLIKASRRLEVPGLEIRTHGWELLPEDAPGKMLMAVYSAFYDDRPTVRSASESVRRLRVLGLCVRHRLQQSPQLRREVFCHYRWSVNPDLHVIQRGDIVSVADGLNSTYQAVFVICDLHLCASPDYVGITLDRKMLPRSYLPVQYPPPIGQRFRHNVTTCLPVMHSHFTDHLGLLQMLETDRLLGTEKFTLHVHSASPEVAAIIRHYVTSGIMEAVEWRLPLVEKEKEEEEEEMQSYVELLAAMNDCLYRAMHVSEHVVFHGFVETLLPSRHSTWTLMLWELQRKEKTSWWEWWRQTLGGAEYGSYTLGHGTFSGSWTPLEQQKEEISKDTPNPYPTQPAPKQPLVVPLSVGQNKILDRKTEKRQRKREPGIDRQMGDPDRKNGDMKAENTKEEDIKEENTDQQRTEGLNDKERTIGRSARSTNDLKNSTHIHKAPESPNGHLAKNLEPKRVSEQKLALPGKTEHRDHQLLHRARYNNSPTLNKQGTLSPNYAERRENSDSLILGVDDNPQKPERTVHSENGNDFPTISKDYTLLLSAERENSRKRSETSFSMLVKPHTVQVMGLRSVQQHVRGYQSRELPADMAGVHRSYPVWRVTKRNAARVGEGRGHHLAWLVRDRMRSVLRNVTRSL